MRLTTQRNLGTLLVASAILLGGADSQADELLVMPYACRMIGGTPVLKPSREQQGHAVIGRREQRPFRACSPVNPDLCQRWTVHRFDLDCDGERVPWVEVAAAAEAVRGDGVFLAGDRLEIEMPPEWSLRPGAPCGGRYREGDAERFGSFERFCDERLARTRPITVAMPRGFAPMFGVDGIFVADSSPRVAGVARSFEDEAAELPAPIPKPQRKAEAAPEPRVEKKTEEPQKVAAATPAPAAKAASAPEPRPRAEDKELGKEAAAPTLGSESKPASEPAREPVKPAPSDAGDVAGPAGPIVPQIINGQNPTAPPQPSQAEAPMAGASPASSPAPAADGDEHAEGISKDNSVFDSSVPDERVETASITPRPESGWALDPDTTLITVAGLATLSLFTLVVLWRRGRASGVPAISRDLAAVSLERTAAQDSGAPTLSALPVVTAPAVGRDLEPSPGAPPEPSETLGDAIPRTRAEALGVLGMGMGPDINEAAVKKIVDGLRVSWHPDHARDAADRATRELRLKQINAAWEILAERGTG